MEGEGGRECEIGGVRSKCEGVGIECECDSWREIVRERGE